MFVEGGHGLYRSNVRDSESSRVYGCRVDSRPASNHAVVGGRRFVSLAMKLLSTYCLPEIFLGLKYESIMGRFIQRVSSVLRRFMQYSGNMDHRGDMNWLHCTHVGN